MPERTLIARRAMPFAPPDPSEWHDEPELYDDADQFDDDYDELDEFEEEFDDFDEFESARAPGARRRAWLLAAGGAAVVALAAGGVLVFRGGSAQGRVNA